MTSIPALKVAVVTGGNKGIGFAICKSLYSKNDFAVILTARDKQLGEQAVFELNKLKQDYFSSSNSILEFHALDITNDESVQKLKSFLREKYNGIDILVNNAGMAFKGNAFDTHVAKTTLATNYFGTVRVSLSLLPLIRDNGRVVMVSSSAGMLNKISKQSLRSQFVDENLTVSKLNSLMEKFIADVDSGKYSEEGWPGSTYAVSKIGMTSLTEILARDPQYASKGILINASCPGWVRTDMAGSNAALSPDQGAETPVWLATNPDLNATGKFYKDKSLFNWKA